MKRTHILIMSLLVSAVAFAQDYNMRVIRNSGEELVIPVADIDKVEFFVDQSIQLDGSSVEYTVKSSGISETETFQCGFYNQHNWNDGYSFTYSLNKISNYALISNSSAFVQISVDSAQLLNGKPFDVAATADPFSFKFSYYDSAVGRDVVVTASNDERDGASGVITLMRNADGLYDAIFDVTLNDGDINVRGYYADVLKPCNVITVNGKEDIAVKAATLDTKTTPCTLYLSTTSDAAGPDNFDIKCQVPKNEWRYGKYMSFSGQSASVTWLDGVRYSSATSNTTPVFGGNWRVMAPVVYPGGVNVAECSVQLYSSPNCYLFYCGKIELIN